MSLSFGGLSLLTSWTPLYFWDDSVHTRSEFRSLVCALVFVAVILILAYLTNPTEVSFRAYLTEQSFRQHLSHLDDLTDDSSSDVNCRSCRSPDRHLSLDRSTLPFHFSSRASVSLRTPKHVFHSFGICTIATTRGAATAGVRRPGAVNGHGHNGHGADHDGSLVSDSWFIGAFGHWWRGGLVDSWYYDAVARSKDAEGWSSGILGFKSLDKLNDQNGLPFAKPVSCPLLSSRGSPPRLRNRERSVQRSGLISRRNSTPPPLPKSASLPLHTDHRIHEHVPSSSQLSLLAPDYKRMHGPPVAHTISRSTSTSGVSDNSPLIAEVLRQIAGAQASVNELKTQVEETQAAASQSHSLLEAELDILRTRKREEDQKRVDGRTRTKALEEARRLAEAGKREAEKKLKTARSTKESAKLRVQELEDEIGKLKQRTEHDRSALTAEPGLTEAEEELVSELELKKKEVRVAEDVVAALHARARELEERISESKERLRAVQERAEVDVDSTRAIHSQTGSVEHVHGNQVETTSSSSPYDPFDTASDVLASPTDSKHPQGSTASDSRDVLRSSKPSQLALGALSNFSRKAHESSDSAVQRTRGYAILDDDVASLAHRGSQSLSHSGQTHNGYLPNGQPTVFSPFSDVQTPSSAYIPSSLISVLDSPSAEWKGNLRVGAGGLATSPVSFASSSISEVESTLDPFEVHHHPQPQGPWMYGELGLPYRTSSDPFPHGPDDLQMNAAVKTSESTPRKWFSSSSGERQHKGLNPDAKVFRLPRRKMQTTSASMSVDASTPPFDALNPTGLMSTVTSSTPSSLLRAFAPSRAEREALQRALNGSTNTSLERLPSLSDVGSIPSSPVPGHAEVQHRSIGEKGCVLPAWLQSLPLIRKPNFSPWEDEEPVSAEVKGM